jgi:hypothetical protein
MEFSTQYDLMIHDVYGKKKWIILAYIITINFLPNMYKVANHSAYLKP